MSSKKKAETPAASEPEVQIASETMLGDLMALVTDEIKALPDLWQRMAESKQEEVIYRVRRRIESAIDRTISILAAGERPAMRATVESVTFKDGVKAVLKLSPGAGGRHELADSTGDEVLVTILDSAAYKGDDTAPAPDSDQPRLNLEDAA